MLLVVFISAGVQEFPDVRPHPELHPEYAQGVFVPAYEWGEAHEDELHPLADTPTVIGQLPPLASMAGSEGQGSAGVALAAAAAPAEEVQRAVALSA